MRRRLTHQTREPVLYLETMGELTHSHHLLRANVRLRLSLVVRARGPDGADGLELAEDLLPAHGLLLLGALLLPQAQPGRGAVLAPVVRRRAEAVEELSELRVRDRPAWGEGEGTG